MSHMEPCQSDLRQSSPDDARNQAREKESKVILAEQASPGTSQINCTAEQNHAVSTARENAIALLIVLANLVPVFHTRFLNQIMADNTRR